jgi:hypothetical protein
MPLAGERLTPEQVGLLRAWIDQGAEWPERVPENEKHPRPENTTGPSSLPSDLRFPRAPFRLGLLRRHAPSQYLAIQ